MKQDPEKVVTRERVARVEARSGTVPRNLLLLLEAPARKSN
jgi:hypothetical protein